MANNNRADRGANRKRGNQAQAVSEAERRDNLARQFGIKPKTRAMIDLMHENPKLSQTEAYIRTHETNNRKNASIEASKLLAKPSVQGYKDSAVKKAKLRIVSLVDSANDNTALKAAQDIIDRNEGKAVQKNEVTSRTVHVSLDLTGLKLGNHYVPASTPLEKLEP